eukprot:gene41381-50497_t
MYVPVASEYWDFLARTPPSMVMPSGVSGCENFYFKTTLCSTVFTLLFAVVPFLAQTLFPKWYESLNARKKKEMPSYVVCMFHHFYLVPIAWYCMVQDFYRQPGPFDYSAIYGFMSPISLGYLIGDTLGYALPELIFHGKTEYMIHHVLSMWLVSVSIFRDGRILRYIPHLLICDSTNIFFNTAWLMRTTSWKDSAIVPVLEVLFAVTFLAFRVINLPLAFLAIFTTGLAGDIGLARFTFLPIVLLQWFWFTKIVAGMGQRFKKKEAKKE